MLDSIMVSFVVRGRALGASEKGPRHAEPDEMAAADTGVGHEQGTHWSRCLNVPTAL